MRTAVALVMALTLGGCDELPERPTTTSTTAPSSVAPASPAYDDAALLPLAKAFMDASRTYAARCEILFAAFEDLTVFDQCPRRGACDVVLKTFSDRPCGYEESEPKAVETALAALEAGTKAKTFSPEGTVFARYAVSFGRFVAKTAYAPPGCKSPNGNPGCYVQTRGTLKRYQDLARAYNAWQPKDLRKLVPIEYTVTGAVGEAKVDRLTFKSKPHGLPAIEWRECPDGVCLR